MVGLRGLEPPTLRLSGVRSNHLSYKPMLSRRWSSVELPPPQTPQTLRFSEFSLLISFLKEISGGDEENRTPDPLLARQVLSQLSYTPVFTGLGCNLPSLFSPF